MMLNPCARAAQDSRREATAASAHKQMRARIDQDAQLAFNADLAAFASKMQVEAVPEMRLFSSPMRSLSPLRR